MSKQANVRDDLYQKWKQNKDVDGMTELSFSDWIDSLLENSNLQEATITHEGRISKALAGKTILYRVKQDNQLNETEKKILAKARKQEYAQTDTTTATQG